jgi:hypothetical protein
MFSFWISLIFAVATGANAIPTVKQSQFLTPAKELRNSRYCEVIPIFRSGINFEIPVFNTAGLNNCPKDLWERLNAKSISARYGAFIVKLNGPRYWMMDSIKADAATKSGRVVEFNGLQLRERATITVNLADILNIQKPYHVNTVKRSTEFTYLKGGKVYELISPTGEIFRMQSYAQIVDQNLKIDDLDRLNEQLKPPKGWLYRVRVLEKDSILKADGVAYVLQDELQNSYQKQTNLP